jgi:hypothetical protein
MRLIFADSGEPALWIVSGGGRAVGSLVCQDGSWRPSWVDGADRRLAGYAGPIDGDTGVLAEAPGVPVHLDSQPA